VSLAEKESTGDPEAPMEASLAAARGREGEGGVGRAAPPLSLQAVEIRSNATPVATIGPIRPNREKAAREDASLMRDIGS